MAAPRAARERLKFEQAASPASFCPALHGAHHAPQVTQACISRLLNASQRQKARISGATAVPSRRPLLSRAMEAQQPIDAPPKCALAAKMRSSVRL